MDGKGFFITMKAIIRIIGIFITAVMLLISGVFFQISASQKARCTQKVTAKVVGFSTHYDEGADTYAPIFEYTYNGGEYRSSNRFYSSSPKFVEGEITEIYIDPENPYDVYVGNEKVMYIAAGVILAWAVVIFVMLVLVFPAMMKLVPKEELVRYTENESDNF